jgi:hypothetical protein
MAGVGLLLAGAVALRLVTALPDVPNRHALLHDAAHRAMDDLDAADALLRSDLAAFALQLVGPQTWPTLRLALAAPLHVIAGPAHALGVEEGLSLGVTALLFLVLALSARAYARSTAGSLGCSPSRPRCCWETATSSRRRPRMLGIPGAVFTSPRRAPGWRPDWVTWRPGAPPCWATSLPHQVQYGLMFAAAVLGLEAVEGGRWRRLPAVGRALLGEVRQPLFLVVLGVLASCTLLAFRAVAGGGVAADSILGLPDGLRSPRLPIWFGAFSLFALVQLALWRGRQVLQALLTPRVLLLGLAPPRCWPGYWFPSPGDWRSC